MFAGGVLVAGLSATAMAGQGSRRTLLAAGRGLVAAAADGVAVLRPQLCRCNTGCGAAAGQRDGGGHALTEVPVAAAPALLLGGGTLDGKTAAAAPIRPRRCAAPNVAAPGSVPPR